ncbi:hypothetical protein CC80DRAFT_497624 [Byssothecium circinans]|uniref:YggU-like protein n=1 Tax=Byssothecium circinans TaxID=147558 RepID=A0A6A5TAM1_9PLEO|nr:hypothetical protein CC80DRAFT_497624 [Byssothecium circinans]
MSNPAIRLVTAKGRQAPISIQLLCRVKPGVSANRQGIAAVSEDAIELCVAARARDGEANRAVRAVIAEALKVPKSDVEVVKGFKSREKTVSINSISVDKDKTPEEEIELIRIILQESVTR